MDIPKRIGSVLGTYWQPWMLIIWLLLDLMVGNHISNNYIGIIKIVFKLLSTAAFAVGVIDLIKHAKGKSRMFLSIMAGGYIFVALCNTIQILATHSNPDILLEVRLLNIVAGIRYIFVVVYFACAVESRSLQKAH